jgi:hypothetical protein
VNEVQFLNLLTFGAIWTVVLAPQLMAAHAKGENPMQTYAIRRRNAWKDADELKATAETSGRIGNEEMADQVRWIRSYVVQEDDGTLGTICIYQAASPEALREHARRVDMPGDEITPVADAVVIRPDPAG